MSWETYFFAAQIPGWDSPSTWVNWTRSGLMNVTAALGVVFIVWMLVSAVRERRRVLAEYDAKMKEVLLAETLTRLMLFSTEHEKAVRQRRS